MIVTSYPVYSGFRANNNEYSLTSLVDMIEEVFLLSLYWDRLFVTIRIIKGGVHDFHGKRQIMRQSLNSTPPVMGGAASGIRPEDFLTMA